MNPPSRLHRINDEVFISADEVTRFDTIAVNFIKTHATQNVRGRARICAHKNPADSLHEMLIAIRSDSYIRPHRHQGKTESFHLIEGIADVVVLSDDGEVADVVELNSKRNFYFRIDAPRYHTLLIYSPMLVIHETTNGPLDLKQTEQAPFSPEEKSQSVPDYIASLRNNVVTWKMNAAGHFSHVLAK